MRHSVSEAVGSADSRYSKGTVALAVSVYRIYAAVRSFCQVTDYASGAYPANYEFLSRKQKRKPVKTIKAHLTELGEKG